MHFFLVKKENNFSLSLDKKYHQGIEKIKRGQCEEMYNKEKIFHQFFSSVVSFFFSLNFIVHSSSANHYFTCSSFRWLSDWRVGEAWSVWISNSRSKFYFCSSPLRQYTQRSDWKCTHCNSICIRMVSVDGWLHKMK